MNQPYARINQPYAMLMLASPLREMFGVQLYKNNACALLSRILSILNLDWLHHARSVRGVYESQVYDGGSVVELWTHDPKVMSLNPVWCPWVWTLCGVLDEGTWL